MRQLEKVRALPQTKEAQRLAGQRTVELLRRSKLNVGEATVAALLMTFYSDVWADTIWQRRAPRGLRGVPDLRHPIGVIGEYDGGGHHWGGDRTTEDVAKDEERRAQGFVAIREVDPFLAATKFGYAVRKCKP